MKKLLTLTILLTTFIQADEEANGNVNICIADARTIIDKGLAPCKENDIYFSVSSITESLSLQKNNLQISEAINMLLICKAGTINTETLSCVLRAEKDFGKRTNHMQHHK
jgi:hypothetical protein